MYIDDDTQARVFKALTNAATQARTSDDAAECRALATLLTLAEAALEPPPATAESIFEGSESAQKTVAEATDRTYKRANKRHPAADE